MNDRHCHPRIGSLSRHDEQRQGCGCVGVPARPMRLTPIGDPRAYMRARTPIENVRSLERTSRGIEIVILVRAASSEVVEYRSIQQIRGVELRW